MPNSLRSTARWCPNTELRAHMFNPKPRIERLDLGGGVACWVVDDLLLEPEALVMRAMAGISHFELAPYNAYPGLEWRMGDDVSGPLNDFFMLHIRSLLQARRTISMYSRLSLATLQPAQLQPLQRICHRDRFGVASDQSVAACTLYLFKDPRLGGTSFFVPRQNLELTNALIRQWRAIDSTSFTRAIGSPPNYLTAGNDYFDLLRAVPAVFNRAVFYDGSIFHSSHIERPDLLSDDPQRGRLTLNGFFICRRNAS
jgi:Family of unknown function (DUF6445)